MLNSAILQLAVVGAGMTSSVGHQVLSSLLVGLIALCTSALLCIQQGMQQISCHIPVFTVSGGATVLD